MNTIKLTTLLGATVLACASVNAGVNVLTFEGLKDNESIDNFYNGGLGGSGSGPGPNYGVAFSSDSLALISTADGGSGNFSGNPSGDTIMYFLSGVGDTMDVAAGFTTGFSFFYSLQVGHAGNLSVYSGLDGTGAVLGTLSLASTPSPYTVWVPVGVAFAGTAESIVFGGDANYIGFDNVTFGSATAQGAPDHTGAGIYLLAGLGLAGAAWVSRKQGIATV